MDELLNELIESIKDEQVYKDYLIVQEKLNNDETKSLLQEYNHKVESYNELKKYNQYVNNDELKKEVQDFKRQLAKNPDIQEYYQKYHELNDYLDKLTKIIFKDISKHLDLSPYKL